MKRILLLIILSLIFCFEAFGQECPTIKIIPPSKLPPDKGFMLFSVSITGKLDNSKLEYNWSVSQGNIFDGQGTTAITIPLDKNLEGEIITTVKINGLAEGCKNIFSDGIMIPIKPQCRCFDEYGKVSWSEEMLKLEQMIVELNGDSKAKGYLIFFFEKDLQKSFIFNRQKKILQYLESRKISLSRIIFKLENTNGYLTRIRILPEGAELPE